MSSSASITLPFWTAAIASQPGRAPTAAAVVVQKFPHGTKSRSGVDERIEHASREILKDPKNAALHLKRGELYRRHREWARALSDYERVRALDPELVIVELCVGHLYLDAGRPE